MALWQKIVVVLLAAAIFGGAMYFTRLLSRPPGWRSHIPWVKYEHPNVRKLKAAQNLVDEGKLPQARDILVNALLTAPISPVTRELRDLLGEVNTEIFFSKEPSPRKIDYTVKSGDALSSIARKLQSSADAIIRVNELDSTLIRPGEKLFVPRLDFTITIDLPRERVIVHDGRGFFTQYPIASTDLPRTRASTLETKVRAKSFWENGRPVSPAHGSAKTGMPWIYLRTRGYVLYGVEETSEDSVAKIDIEDEDSSTPHDASEPNRPPHGIAMLKKDIAELEVLIHKGTPVTIILDQKQ